MRKYEDTWVVDRTMFEYVNQVAIDLLCLVRRYCC
jgi:hypothetical protein